jgi:hypothetical protein
VAVFPWQLLPGLAPPYPTVFLDMVGTGQPVAIAGLFDTGASITTLRAPVEQPRLGVTDDVCIPSPATDASGVTTWHKLTMLTGRLDGHDFDVPTVFSDGVPINLIGRVGFMDIWAIRHDSPNAVTHFDWIGPQPAWGNRAWGDHWKDYWQKMLARRCDWTNWSRWGRPPVPPAPLLPAMLPAPP